MKENHYFLARSEEQLLWEKSATPLQQAALEGAIELGLRGQLTERQFRSLTRGDGSGYGHNYALRALYCQAVSWSVMTAEWIADIAEMAKGRRVLEIGAGRGILGKIMPELTGAEWLCTDVLPPEGADHVIRMRANPAVRKFQPDVVFASWIPYRSTLDLQLARQLPCIFLGEVGGGCTGSEAFWYEGADRDFRVEYPKIRDVPRWFGIRDQTFRTFPIS